MEKKLCLAGSAVPDMLEPSFWKGSSALRMTAGEIVAYNDELRRLPGTGLVDLTNFPVWLEGEAVGQMIADCRIGSGFLDGQPMTEQERKTLLRSCNLTCVPPKVTVKYGVTCSPADLRRVPTDQVFTSEGGRPTEETLDLFQESQLHASECVIILHHSADQQWAFVQAANDYGWVREGKLRLCDRYHFLSALEQRPAPLPFTSGNFYETALSFVGWPYRWGRFDCSALVVAVYERFGIYLPRNTSQMALIRRNVHQIGQNPLEELSALRPGALLLMPGHVMLYLSCVNGFPYALQTFTRYADSSGQKYPVFTTAVTSLHDFLHQSGKPFLDCITSAIELPK